jgi:hypothetical protein
VFSLRNIKQLGEIKGNIQQIHNKGEISLILTNREICLCAWQKGNINGEVG